MKPDTSRHSNNVSYLTSTGNIHPPCTILWECVLYMYIHPLRFGGCVSRLVSKHCFCCVLDAINMDFTSLSNHIYSSPLLSVLWNSHQGPAWLLMKIVNNKAQNQEIREAFHENTYIYMCIVNIPFKITVIWMSWKKNIYGEGVLKV